MAVIAGLVAGVAVRDSTARNADAAPVSTAMAPTAGAAVAMVGGEEVVVWRGTDGAVWTAVGAAPAAGSAISLGGGIVGAPDIAASPDGNAVMVALGGDGATWMRRRAANGTWAPWQSLGGRFGHAPTVVSWGNGRFDVFGVGTDEGTWQAWTQNGGGTWQGWSGLGGRASAAPDATSRAFGTLDVAIRGADGAVWLKTWTGAAWTGWSSVGGVIAGGPGLASNARGDSLTVVARTSDNAIYTQRFSAGQWSGWSRRDGALRSEPEASLVRGAVTFVGIGLDGRFWAAAEGGGWAARSWGDPPRPTDPYGAIETLGLPSTTTVVVSGWAVDASDPQAPVTVEIVVDGVVTATSPAALPHSTGLHGFSVSANAPAGARTVCVRGRDVGVGDNAILACRDISPPAPGNFAFVALQPRGNPVRFNPCGGIPIVFNSAGGPASALAELNAAVAQLRSATGMNLYVEGYTNEVAATNRPTVNAGLYGLRWSPILVGFSDPSRTPALAGGVAGLGGAAATNGPDGRLFVTGSVILDGPQALTLPTGFGDGPTQAKLILHELAHVLGLAHVADTSQLMNPVIPNRAGGLGWGDLGGLSWLGIGQPCLRVPTPLLGAVAIAGDDASGPETPNDVDWYYQAHTDDDH